MNDNLGHSAGDELLRFLADRMRGQLRHGDLLARLGGDEFLVALPGLQAGRGRELAQQVAEKLRGALAAPTLVRGVPVAVAASIGVSVFPADASTVDELLHVAGVRMYEAKTR